MNVLNFERYKWGGARHHDPLYVALDLELFSLADRPEPTRKDYDILKGILSAARTLPDAAGPNDLCKAIAKQFPSNVPERRQIVETLAMCGVLAVGGRPGYLESFTAHSVVEQDRPSDNKNDWSYPAIWWRGRDGVNEHVVDECFPLLRSSLSSH